MSKRAGAEVVRRKVKAIPQRGYAVYDESGRISQLSFFTRADAISKAIFADVPNHWHFLKLRGCTTREVEIREVTTRKSKARTRSS